MEGVKKRVGPQAHNQIIIVGARDGTPHHRHPSFFSEGLSVYPGWPQTPDPPVSTLSSTTRIEGMHYHT